ncbi:hypothetical protein [Rhizobiales bacterium]|uniref:hypothetical protein n=1 Tax=Mycoplana sp. MJR14 TaxID=3032583 RepID=UPI0011D060FC
MSTILLGAALVFCGVLFLFRGAIRRRPLSDLRSPSPSAREPTLEPKGQALRFLGLARNWPGFAMIAAGGVMLLLGAWRSGVTVLP